MKQAEAKMIANEVLNQARSESLQAGSVAYKPQPVTSVNVEKIENGYLVKSNGLQIQPFGKTIFVESLTEIPEVLETIFK